MRLIAFVLACAACACSRELTLPAPAAVAVTGLTPASGWAGQRVRITGHNLGTRDTTDVRIGVSSRVAPLEVADDASWLDVLVPDDASDGVVSVTTPLGQVSGPAFQFLGLGRLRQQAIVATADLRPKLDRLVATDGNEVDAIDLGAGWAGALSARHGWQRLSVREPLALAYATKARQELVVTLDVSHCPLNAVAKVEFPRSDLSAVCLRGGAVEAGSIWSIATDSDAMRIVVASGEVIWAVDLAGPTPAVTTFAASSSYGAVVAWVGADRFLAFDDDGARGLTFDPGAAMTDPIDAVSAIDVVAVDVNFTTQRALYCAFDDNVYMLDLSAWPPTAVEGAPALLHHDCAGVALSPDGTRAAISQQLENIVTLVDLTSGPRWLVLAQIPVDTPAEVVAGRDSFHVASRGGVRELSLRTGELLETVPLTANLGTPVIRGPAVEVPRGTFNTLVRVAPDTLRGVAWGTTGLQGVFDLRLDEPPVDELATDGKTLWLRHDRELRVLRDPAGALPFEDPAQRWTPASYSSVGTPRLFAEAAGKGLFFHYDAGSFSVPDWKMAVLDPAATWSATYAPPLVPMKNHATFGGRLVQSAAGATWLVDKAQVRKIDVAAAVRGDPVPDGTPLSTTGPLAAATAQGALFVGEGPSLGDPATIADVRRIDASGAVLTSKTKPDYTAPDAAGFVLSPSGTRLYFLRGAGSLRKLVVQRFDAETGDAGEELGSIPMPPTASALVPFSDGSKMLVLDAEGDRLLLVR